jgi:Asp-tRNA(Asn)/Glu-tRNA(Gln) amidotransferase A subunit family amidase
MVVLVGSAPGSASPGAQEADPTAVVDTLSSSDPDAIGRGASGAAGRADSAAEHESRDEIDAAVLAEAEKIIGLEFDAAERDSMLDSIVELRKGIEKLREVPLDNGIPPALSFDPRVPGFETPSPERSSPEPLVVDVEMPDDPQDLAYYSVAELAVLLRTGRITSVYLTELYLDRLKRYGPELECVITLTEDLALERARRADEELASGDYRGPLHGIPYGLKDLFAVPEYPTTWGAMPYKDQVREETAAVALRLEEAGAVLVAKLTLGALAWGDVWYGGRTRNPWNPEEGSSGSSAGSAAATSAGLVGFAIGTETWGSIVSPCTRCGCTGLRPTFGRVSRAGAMALSWSMDKVGPICRSVDDCAMVFDAIHGPDGIDRTVVDEPFHYDPYLPLGELRIGYVEDLFEEEYDTRENDLAVLDVLRGLGADLTPIELPDLPIGPLALILEAEAAAAFDELTRSGRDDMLVRQVKQAWPNVFRAARFIPAVEYVQANRIRFLAMREMDRLMAGLDAYVVPTYGGDNLLLTNLTGHPCVVVPNGFNEQGSPTSITFVGKLYGEATLLAVARTYQEETGFHRRRPEGFR